MADFAVSVGAWVAKAKVRSDVAFRAIAAKALERVKELTPVRTGYLRANWQASFDGDVKPIDVAMSGREMAGQAIQLGTVFIKPFAHMLAVNTAGAMVEGKGVGEAAGSGLGATAAWRLGPWVGSLVSSAVGLTPAGRAATIVSWAGRLAMGAIGGAVGGQTGAKIQGRHVKGTDPLKEARVGDVIYIINPVVYAKRIEFGFNGTDSLGRNYHYHGRGMMQQTIVELPALAQGVVNDLNRMA